MAPAVLIDAHPDGAVLRVRAAPGASRERVVGVHGDALKVAVSAPPEKGKANRRLAQVLAAALDLPVAALELLSGSTSRDKRFLVRDVTPDALRARVTAAIGG